MAAPRDPRDHLPPLLRRYCPHPDTVRQQTRLWAGWVISLLYQWLTRMCKGCGRGWVALDATSRLFLVCTIGLVLFAVLLPSVTLWGFAIVGLLVFGWRTQRWRELDRRGRSFVVCGNLASVVALVLAIGRLSGKPADETRNTNTLSAASDKGAAPQSTTSPAAPRFRYTITELGTLGGDSTNAVAINSKGQVVGDSETKPKTGEKLGERHAFIWEAGVGMRDLGTLGGAECHAVGINNKGQVIGRCETGRLYKSQEVIWGADGAPDHVRHFDPPQFVGKVSPAIPRWKQLGYEPTHAFLWDWAHGMQDLDSRLGEPEYSDRAVEARAINDNGDVVGVWRTTGGTNGFLLKADGSIKRTGMGAMPDIEPVGINSRGDIAGTLKGRGAGADDFPVLLQTNGELRQLPTPGGEWKSMSITAMNGNGQLVCVADNKRGGNCVLLRESDGTLKKIQMPTLDPGILAALRRFKHPIDLSPNEPGFAYAAGINRKGHVVGFYGPPNYELPADPQPEKPIDQVTVLLGGPSKPYQPSLWSPELSSGFVYDGRVASDLNALTDPASGWHIEQANAINDGGQIIVCASNYWLDEKGQLAGPGAVGHLRFATLLLTPVLSPQSTAKSPSAQLPAVAEQADDETADDETDEVVNQPTAPANGIDKAKPAHKGKRKKHTGTRNVSGLARKTLTPPRRVSELAKRGFAAGLRGDWDLAHREFTAAIEFNGGDANAYCGRAWAYLERCWQKGMDPSNVSIDPIIEDCSKANQLDPTDPDAFFVRGSAWLTALAPNNAIPPLTEAIRLDPKNPSYYCIRAYANAWISRRGDAYRVAPTPVEDCSEAIRVDSNYAIAYVCRGWYLDSLSRKGEARADYDKALSIRQTKVQTDTLKLWIKVGFTPAWQPHFISEEVTRGLFYHSANQSLPSKP